MDRDAELVTILREPARYVYQHPFLDVVQDLLVAGFVAHQQQPKPVVGKYLQGVARHVGLGVA